MESQETVENTTPQKEISTKTGSAFMFDIDGVLTNPDTKEVNDRLIQFIAQQLDSGKPTALFTGRAFEWADEKIIKSIRNHVKSENSLDLLFVSSEHGAVSITYLNGSSKIEVDKHLDIPEELKTKAREVVSKYEGVFYDPQKLTMVSLEIEGGADKDKVKREKIALDQIEQELLELVKENAAYKVIRSEIAVDVLSKNAGKRIASTGFLEFVRSKGIDPSEYILFGDTPSDIEAADEMSTNKKLVRFAYVGTRDLPERDYPVIRASNAKFDKATEEILNKYFVEYQLPTPEFWGETFSIVFMSPNGFELQTGETLIRDEKLPIDFPSEHIRRLNTEEREFWVKRNPDVQPLGGKDFKPKVGLRNPRRDGDKIVFDIKPVTYPTYVGFGRASSLSELIPALEIGSPAATAMILLTTEPDGSSKMIVQHRGKNNRLYADVPGASAAGLLDGQFFDVAERNEDKDLRAKLRPIDTDSVISNVTKEAEEEIGVKKEELVDVKINGLSLDAVQIHWEFTFQGRTKLSVSELQSRIAEKAIKSENAHAFDFDEQYFVLDASPEVIKKLLGEVRCPLPPTHAAAFVTTGYALMAEKAGIKAAESWKKEVEEMVKLNYREINKIVSNFYTNHPELVQERYGNKHKEIKGYDPLFRPQEQGVPDISSELERVKLI